ncbi:acyltransferase family protein [Spirosoma areae]
MDNLKRRTIDGGSSIILDSLRILSALIVVVHHANMQWLTNYYDIAELSNNLSHAAVVVFFVLSGYLIAYTTTSNNRGFIQYTVARLSRLYSTVAPALLLTAIIEIVVNIIDPALAMDYTRGSSWPRYALSIVFCNEIALFSAAPPINGPLWSLSFEFWYYTIFGLWFYRSSNWKSLLLPIGACLIAGPKILLLMPIWLCGFMAYQLPRPKITTKISWLFVFLFLFIAAIGTTYLPAFPFPLGQRPFYLANRFITDWAIGIFVALALWYLPYQERSSKSKGIKLLRTVADLSFPLYVLHYPLLVLWRAVFGWRPNDVVQMCQAIVSVILLATLIGLFLESQRNNWARFFRWTINRIWPQALKIEKNYEKPL